MECNTEGTPIYIDGNWVIVPGHHWVDNDKLRQAMCASAAAIGSALFEYDAGKLIEARQILLKALTQ